MMEFLSFFIEALLRIRTAFSVWAIFTFYCLSLAFASDLEWFRWKGSNEVAFGGFVDEIRAIRTISSGEGKGMRIIYGDRLGLVHAIKFQEGRFQEEWTSSPLKAAISEVFVEDINADGNLEIVAYTENGDFAFYRGDNYKQIWRITEGQYASISSMIVANVDDDPQLELVFCAVKAGDLATRGMSPGGIQNDQDKQRELSRLFIYDCLSYIDEWSGEQGLSAQSILVGDLDADGILEIVLNSGFVVDSRTLVVEWRYSGGFSQSSFGHKIGYADLDGDGIPELIGEFESSTTPRRFIRIFDVELQAESFLSKDR